MGFKLENIKFEENGLEQEIKGNYEFSLKGSYVKDKTFCRCNKDFDDDPNCQCDTVRQTGPRSGCSMYCVCNEVSIPTCDYD